ncbi:hypothetical protein D3C72_685790 [compost metagenome]
MWVADGLHAHAAAILGVVDHNEVGQDDPGVQRAELLGHPGSQVHARLDVQLAAEITDGVQAGLDAVGPFVVAGELVSGDVVVPADQVVGVQALLQALGTHQVLG